MSKIEKINKLSNLFDVYNGLLTDNQKDVFTLYYLEDNSLAEIAEMMSVSRPSVSDTLKKTEEKLIKFEEKLELVKRNNKLDKLVDKIEDENLQKKIKELL